MKRIMFLTDMRPHNAGDTRLVDDETADRLTIAGYARVVALVDHRDLIAELPAVSPAAIEAAPRSRRPGRPRKYFTR